MDKQTSDERLLKLIEGESGPKHPGIIAPGLRKAPIKQLSVKFNFHELKSKLRGLKVNLFFLNRGLIGIAALLTLIFLYVLLSSLSLSKSSSAIFSSGDATAMIKLISTADVQGLMRKGISNQDIKRDFFLPAGSLSRVTAQEDGPDLTGEMKHLKLVGIIWSQEPEAMIENAKDSRTYTLKKGESLNGQFKVKEVSRSAVTLEVVTDAGSREYVLR